MSDDGVLLRQFAETHDEAPFAALVERYGGFVYAVSLRRLQDVHAAQDATQAVFIALARKAATVARGPSVIGWLHRSACYETNNLMRARARQLARDTEALRLGVTAGDTESLPSALDAVLDEALHELPDQDREAILARFFGHQSYAEIGVLCRLSENAARMRVERALARLRDQLTCRGITSTAAALAVALPGYAVTAPLPTGLAAAITQASVAGIATGATASGIFAFMSTTKIATATVLVALSAGLGFQYYQTAQLGSELAAAREERATTRRQLATLERQLADAQRRASQDAHPGAAPAPASTHAPVSAAPVNKPGVAVMTPKGWAKNGTTPDAYEVGVDESQPWGGMPSAYIKSVGETKGQFGGMMQTIAASAYQNQRVRLNGWLKTDEVGEGGGHLWLRVDGSESGKPLAFDNLTGRAPKGTTDWQEYSIVVDVPADATTLNYGAFVQGAGQMWINGVTITPVGADTPSTDMLPKLAKTLPAAPQNLGFASPPAN